MQYLVICAALGYAGKHGAHNTQVQLQAYGDSPCWAPWHACAYALQVLQGFATEQGELQASLAQRQLKVQQLERNMQKLEKDHSKAIKVCIHPNFFFVLIQVVLAHACEWRTSQACEIPLLLLFAFAQ